MSNQQIDNYENKVWYNKEGYYHREDGPAIEYEDGSKAWFINGKKHRLDGPAYDGISGYKAWWLKGKRHRTNGPAIIYQDGKVEYYINGKCYDSLEEGLMDLALE